MDDGNWGQLWGSILALIGLSVWQLYEHGLIGPSLEEREEEKQRAREEEMKIWYGVMYCTDCGYRWMSRKSTPPAKCPSCSKRSISPMMGVKR